MNQMTLDHTAHLALAEQSGSADGISRRTFLRAAAAAGGGLMLSLRLRSAGRDAAAAGTDGFTPNAFIHIATDGQVVLIMPYVQMGQGTYTSIPMLIAEELEVDLSEVRLEHAPPNEKLYANPLLGVQVTGNSNAIRGAWQPLRRAARGALAMAATKVDATYEVPFLAHAAMEPMNCTVHARKDECEIWIGTQAIARVQAEAARVTGLPVDKVVVHNHMLGGGFGRRLESDGAARAVQIALHVDGPVKVVWTREEDIQHDMYRPYWFDRFSAGLDNNGLPVAWEHRFAGSSVIARYLPPAFKDGLDPDSTEGAIDLVYALPNKHVEYVRVEPPGVPTAFWRSVGPSHTVFVVESFMDELAAAAKQDAVAYRLALLDKTPRAKAVLALAAEKAGWGQPLPERVGRGVSVQNVFATYMAQVAEVEVSKDGAVRVRRVVCAVDCGTVINPDTVQAQVQSAIIFGITAALHGQITLKDGRVEQTNFDNYRILRMNEAPAIEVHIVQRSEPPGGIGECGTSAIVPAVANAIFAATGKRLRKMPVDAAALRQPA
jgi:isoquinoline 1-oxidoreductase subunit beta